jgi:hypothetical protein
MDARQTLIEQRCRLQLRIHGIEGRHDTGLAGERSIAQGQRDAPTLALAEPSKSVVLGSTAMVGLTITRDENLTGALTVHVDGLSAGLTVADVAVGASASTGTLVVDATTGVEGAEGTPGGGLPP